MADRFAASLVNKTNPRPWDQVLVLSQAALNAGLKNTWLAASTDSNTTSTIRHVNLESRTSGSIKGDLGPPTIIIDIANSGYWYVVPFIKGTLQLRTGQQANPTARFDLTGWTLRYRVPYFVRDTLKPGTREYHQFFEKTTLQVPSNAAFSLTRLSIGLDLPTLSECHCGRYGEYGSWQRSQSSKVVDNFQALLIELSGKGQLGQGTVVGVFFTTSTPAIVNSLAPCFPPTSVSSAMYPWLDPNSPRPITGSNKSENAFAYLIMTGNNSAPSPPKLDYSGAFVNSIADNATRLCIGAEQFWLNWFCPLMQLMNRAVEITCPKANLQCKRDSVAIQSVYLLGSNNAHHDPVEDPYFKFTPNSNSANGSPLPATWSSDGKDHQSTATDKCVMNKSVFHFVVTEKSKNSTSVSFTPGSPKLRISGSSTFQMRVDQTSSSGDNSNSDCSVTIDWSVHYTLGHVAGASDALAVIPDVSVDPYIQLNVKPSRNDGSGWTSNWTNSAHTLGAQIYANIKAVVDATTTSLATGLSQVHRFFLPGSGTFVIKDAFFNVRGDLLVALDYDELED